MRHACPQARRLLITVDGGGCEVFIRGRWGQELVLRGLRWEVTVERLKGRALSLDEDNARAFRSDPVS
jgi:hypothetical protein